MFRTLGLAVLLVLAVLALVMSIVGQGGDILSALNLALQYEPHVNIGLGVAGVVLLLAIWLNVSPLGRALARRLVRHSAPVPLEGDDDDIKQTPSSTLAALQGMGARFSHGTELIDDSVEISFQVWCASLGRNPERRDS